MRTHALWQRNAIGIQLLFLHFASSSGRSGVLVHELSACRRCAQFTGETPLHLAAHDGAVDVVRELLDCDAYTGYKDDVRRARARAASCTHRFPSVSPRAFPRERRRRSALTLAGRAPSGGLDAAAQGRL